MLKRKQKIKLSDNLKFGVEGPSSQGALFKLGGGIFLVLSLLLAVNIVKGMSVSDTQAASQNTPGKVLGAVDDKRQAQSPAKPTQIAYIVQKGDTLFNIAQTKNVNWVVIATMNNLKAPYDLKPGTVIQLPVTAAQ